MRMVEQHDERVRAHCVGDNSLLVVALAPPSRFPTVVHDPGGWWSALRLDDHFRLVRFSANYEFWQALCGPDVIDLLGGSLKQRLVRKIHERDLRVSGIRAQHALEQLRAAASFASPERYIRAVTPIASHIKALNRLQDELQFLPEGIFVRGLNYDSSHALAEYAERDTLLARLVSTALGRCPSGIRLLAVKVTAPEDLLGALVAVRLLRRKNSQMHACLVDHSYENFSLTPYAPRLRGVGTLKWIFDTIVESQDERDVVVPALAHALARGERPRGFLRAGDIEPVPAAAHYTVPPAVPVLAPEPILWTRLSPRRCYWSRCTFCVQNLKYSGPQPPSLAEVPAVVERLEAVSVAGYRTVILSDEALSPALLDSFSRMMVARGVRLNWGCRCKLERGFTPELFARMRAAGCCNVLFGLESISPRILRHMDKYVEGLDSDGIARILADADAAGIAIHVNLIAGFPGDTPEEATASVDFVVRILRDMSDATFILNDFTLFHGSPVADTPAAYGIERLPADGDIPWAYAYEFLPGYVNNGTAVLRMIPELRARLARGLGWDRYGDSDGAQFAIRLYFRSGLRYTNVFRRLRQRALGAGAPLNQDVRCQQLCF